MYGIIHRMPDTTSNKMISIADTIDIDMSMIPIMIIEMVRTGKKKRVSIFNVLMNVCA